MLCAHLRSHEFAGELVYPIRCSHSSCTSTLKTVWGLGRHLHKFHVTDHCAGDSTSVQPFTLISHSKATGDECDLTEMNAMPPVKKICLSDVQAAGIKLVAALHANSSVPNSVITEVVSSINEISVCACEFVKQEVSSILEDNVGVTQDVVKHVEETIDTVRRPLQILSSRRRQDDFFQNHPLFVPSESVPLGCRYEVRNGQNIRVNDSYEYVSVERTVRSLLQSSEYVQLLCQSADCSDVIGHFTHGTRNKNHHLFSDESKFTISIQLFTARPHCSQCRALY